MLSQVRHKSKDAPNLGQPEIENYLRLRSAG